ncbi:MAG: hypothetical protein JAY95_10340 [Candidatus Thiodiazotropha taylori]|nr:hypothetical protein [Candidatus Thiodiazotropha taylori]
MIRLEGGTHFLVTRRLIDRNLCSIQAYRRFNDALAALKSDQRISPLFPIGGANPPNPKTSRSFFIFLGPVYPGLLDFSSAPDLYLTLGTYNVLAWCQTDSQREELIAFADSNKIPYEVWTLNKHKEVTNIDHSHIKDREIPEEGRKALTVSPELRTTAREYSLLISKAFDKSPLYWPNQLGDFLMFDTRFKEVLDKENDDLGRLTDLVVTNAAISRFLSQAYSGTSPIGETESGYTINSLLGIGIASQALVSIRDFASKTFTESQLLQRVKLLKEVSPIENSPFFLISSDHFFSSDILNNDNINEALRDHPRDDILPTLTCFSGRDGFRATRFSLSAPLEVITGANTFQWTLLTLTHEISHIIIEGVLGEFFPEPKDISTLAKSSLLLNDTNASSSLYDQAKHLLLCGFALLYIESHQNIDANNNKQSKDITIDPSPESIRKYIMFSSPEANEILTHIFDFLYFYNSNVDHYIRSVWSSWAVVPNIETRIPEYINRTICALYAAKMEWPIENTIATFKDTLLKLLQDKDSNKPEIISQALEYLNTEEKKLEDSLNYRIPLVKFVRAFLYSSTIAAEFTREKRPAPPAKRDNIYSFSGKEFRKETITNPLRFLEQHAVEHTPKMLTSVWMLQHLAFCEFK